MILEMIRRALQQSDSQQIMVFSLETAVSMLQEMLAASNDKKGASQSLGNTENGKRERSEGDDSSASPEKRARLG